jgi:nucleoside-diphosphate-sugar epimerase
VKKALVTGGCGFIGSNLTKELVKQGWLVDIVDDMSNGHIALLDGLKKRILPSASFHQAAVPRVSYSVENPWHTTDVNISKTVKLFEAATGAVKRIVWASSSSVYGGADVMPTSETVSKNPKSPYAWQKSAIEDYAKLCCDLYDIDIVCLRYFNVFGPGQYGDSPYSTAVSAWCHAIKNGLECRSDGDGEQTRDMTYVDNVVHANIRAANFFETINGECYNVACGDKVSNNEILAWLKKRYGEKVKIRNAPERVGDVKHTQADISKIRRQLGYTVQIKFWEGLENTVKWWGLDG